MLFPSTACLVQHKLGAKKAMAFDIEAACSGFVYALEIGRKFIESGSATNVLVIGAEKISSIIDWTDRATCVLFGDGAGAAVLQHRPGARGIITTCLASDGTKGEFLCMPGGGSRIPATTESVSTRQHFLRMNGKDTFKSAVNAMVAVGFEALEKAGLTINDIKLVIPHQANLRIISAVGERLGVSAEKTFVNLDRYGNTSAASVAIALDEAVTTGRLVRGDLVEGQMPVDDFLQERHVVGLDPAADREGQVDGRVAVSELVAGEQTDEVVRRDELTDGRHR